MDFSGLVLGLCSSALSYMGGGDSDNADGVNLTLAKQNIEILEVLKEKTTGNLTEQETLLLSQALSDLHGRYKKIADSQKI